MRKLTMKNWNVLALWYGWMEEHGNKRVSALVCWCNVDWLSRYNDDWLSEYGISPWHYSKVKGRR